MLLAQELLDLTLDHLHYDPETLKRCALASKSLLPTCQRHLFSTYRITKSNITKLMELFAFRIPIGGHDGEALRAQIADLLNTYTTHLILTDYLTLVSGSAVEKAHFPEFKNVQGITFKGTKLGRAIKIPSFLGRTWMSPSSRIRSVQFDFRFMCEDGILESLYTLPASVENFSFTCTRYGFSSDLAATPIHEGIQHQPLSSRSCRGVHQFNGTMKLHLAPRVSYGPLLSAMLKPGGPFKFSLKRINYRLVYPTDLCQLASLVDECKDTLQSLDIIVSSPGPSERDVKTRYFDFSHHNALRSIRIWTPVTFDPDWLCAAISSIQKPSSVTPRDPPLRIELHTSTPCWMTYPNTVGSGIPEKIDKLVTSWIPIDTQLSRLIGLDPDTPSAKSITDVAAAGISLDISLPGLTVGPGKGVAALMFPLLSDVKGLVRLV